MRTERVNLTNTNLKVDEHEVWKSPDWSTTYRCIYNRYIILESFPWFQSNTGLHYFPTATVLFHIEPVCRLVSNRRTFAGRPWLGRFFCQFPLNEIHRYFTTYSCSETMRFDSAVDGRFHVNNSCFCCLISKQSLDKDPWISGFFQKHVKWHSTCICAE